jgi:glycosyltransferase involved in cell wall biosynthesis
MRAAAFAIPGDLDQKTGGYIYEKSLLLALRAGGRAVRHVELPAGFPHPSDAEMAVTLTVLSALSAEEPLILDGLVFAAVDTAGLAALPMPVVAMTHHPVGLETGLPSARAAELLRREADNLALAAHVVVPSPHTAQILTADLGVAPDRISIAPPGFAKPEGDRAPESPPLILSVGLLAARKGHDVLLRALAQLTDLEWRAEIVGGTHDAAVADDLRRLQATLGLSDRVAFVGLLDEAELQARYRSATLFTLATRYEGYGMVFSEALCHGLPIVTTRAGAVPDTVPESAGLLVPPDDAEALAEAMRRVLADAGLRHALSEGGLKAARDLPTWADTARIMGRVLDSV